MEHHLTASPFVVRFREDSLWRPRNERLRRDCLLRDARLRRGITALWNLALCPLIIPPPPPAAWSSSVSSSTTCAPRCPRAPENTSRAPCMERRTLPTQPDTWAWAVVSLSPKYCILREESLVLAVTALWRVYVLRVKALNEVTFGSPS